jgi:Sec-independent protein translocase protein TatA
MGAIKPWHLLVCLIVVVAIVGTLVVVGRSARRK